MQLPQIIHVVQDVNEAKGENSHHVKGKRQQKQKKVAVVSSPDAVVHPGTVMVKVLERSRKGNSISQNIEVCFQIAYQCKHLRQTK